MTKIFKNSFDMCGNMFNAVKPCVNESTMFYTSIKPEQ